MIGIEQRDQDVDVEQRRAAHIAGQEALVADLDRSCLFIQRPPGSGKTWTGARLIVSLMAKGHRIGVAAESHKAIHNLLEEVENVATDRGVSFEGLKKGNGADSQFDGRFIHSTSSNQDCEAGHARLVAGTSWLFSRPGMEQSLDYLFIDEAGQISLGHAVAMGLSARNVVLLGDPQQLSNLSQGVHAAGSGVSVLEHLLGEAATVGESERPVPRALVADAPGCVPFHLRAFVRRPARVRAWP